MKDLVKIINYQKSKFFLQKHILKTLQAFLVVTIFSGGSDSVDNLPEIIK